MKKYEQIVKNRKYSIDQLQADRICINCNKSKKCLDFFRKPALKDGFDKRCIECRRIIQYKYEQSLEYKKGRQEYYYYKTYKLSIEEVDDLKKQYNYKCAICNTDEEKLKRKLHIDHCHATGKIRGVLCDNCNKSLGAMKDSIIILENAIKYLKENEVKTNVKVD